MSEEHADELFRRGLGLFNAGQFFECHEVWEDLWRTQIDPERQFTQGLIQLAVATYHLRRANYVGAVKLYKRSIARLEPFAPEHHQLDIGGLVAQARHLLSFAEQTRSPSAMPTISPVRSVH